ncbi:uncharacterized protein BP5553_10349 [Venustampulla echinocandica]|uniref:Uncharacterized protein n=1 Tax=Venustampulla echinocandica TaxID=2656787 RepID=A0A370TA10_9HELO|nr:uncharacterized protein BP5553_10349 [Venustampulla echinocandica]RDL30471.1 hypothetical protein BP5553_10349 [Venustampulla echinocandica]
MATSFPNAPPSEKFPAFQDPAYNPGYTRDLRNPSSPESRGRTPRRWAEKNQGGEWNNYGQSPNLSNPPLDSRSSISSITHWQHPPRDAGGMPSPHNQLHSSAAVSPLYTEGYPIPPNPQDRRVASLSLSLFDPESASAPIPTSPHHSVAIMTDPLGQDGSISWDPLQLGPGNSTMEEQLGNFDKELWNPRGYMLPSEPSTVPSKTSTGPGTSASDFDGADSLQKAAYHGHAKVVELLLNSGADIRGKNSLGETAIHLAAKRGHQPVLTLLLEKCSHAQVQGMVQDADNNGQVPLHLAARNGHRTVVRMLLNANANANINACDLRGQTALHVASADGHVRVVQLLLERGININQRMNSGLTALHKAAEHGRDAVVRLLLECGADANAKSHEG